jgi:osmotically-inducible protein OsmY
MNRFVALASAVALAFGLGACGTPIGTVAGFALEDRSAEDHGIDTKIEASVFGKVTQIDKMLAIDLTTNAWEGRVLLTGIVEEARLRDAAVRAARETQSVKVVYNDIVVVTKAEAERMRKAKEAGKAGKEEPKSDFVINAKIKAALVGASSVTSVNYRWESVNNTVSILGRAGSADEKNLVMALIKAVDGVKGVKDYVEIKPVAKKN